MSKTLLVVVATKAQLFPADTIEGSYVFTLDKADGTTVASVTSVDPKATFEAVDAGDYTVSVTKNGVSASVAYTVPEDAPEQVSLQVPDTITITF